MKPSNALSPAPVLAVLVVAVQAAADQSARLTIGGYMPPRQRVVAVEPVATTSSTRGIRLEVQGNSADSFILAADWKDIQTGQTRPAGWRTQQSNRITPHNSQQPGSRTASTSASRQPQLTHLEIEPPPSTAGYWLCLTIASR